MLIRTFLVEIYVQLFSENEDCFFYLRTSESASTNTLISNSLTKSGFENISILEIAKKVSELIKTEIGSG